MIAGKTKGRATSEEVVVFDGRGTALQDLAAAAMMYHRALELGTGGRIVLGS